MGGSRRTNSPTYPPTPVLPPLLFPLPPFSTQPSRESAARHERDHIDPCGQKVAARDHDHATGHSLQLMHVHTVFYSVRVSVLLACLFLLFVAIPAPGTQPTTGSRLHQQFRRLCCCAATSQASFYAGPLQSSDVHIGRGAKDAPRPPWPNQYLCGTGGSRQQVAARFASRLRASIALMQRLPELEGKVLRCNCSPGTACRADAQKPSSPHSRTVTTSPDKRASSSTFLVTELFCGLPGVARRCKDLGCSVFAVDWHENRHKLQHAVEVAARDKSDFNWVSPPALSRSDQATAACKAQLADLLAALFV